MAWGVRASQRGGRMWAGLASLHMKGLLEGRLFIISRNWLQSQQSPRYQSIRNTENNEA